MAQRENGGRRGSGMGVHTADEVLGRRNSSPIRFSAFASTTGTPPPVKFDASGSERVRHGGLIRRESHPLQQALEPTILPNRIEHRVDAQRDQPVEAVFVGLLEMFEHLVMLTET